jgi:Subtilase family
MPTTPNLLLGYGERLTETISVSPHGGPKEPPYTFEEARARLIPMLEHTSRDLLALPSAACPDNRAVAVLTLHPEYLAKSYFPDRLLKSAGLESIGSRPALVTPQKSKITRQNKPSKPAETTELFVAGLRAAFGTLAIALPHWNGQMPEGDQLPRIELCRAQIARDRLQPVHTRADQLVLEVVLHASEDRSSNFILEGFESFLSTLGLAADFDRRFYVGGLCFLPMRAPRDRMPQIAQFAFLRVLRQMPRLRMLNPIRSIHANGFPCALPMAAAQDVRAQVAIFDGGLLPNSPLARWVRPIDPLGIGNPVPDFLDHGHQVTSALLFGSLKPGELPPTPFAGADHYRVLDDTSHTDPLELYDVLQRIRNVLQTNSYEFINLCIGPALPVEDTEVHGWTAFFDEYLSSGSALAAIAVGNGGENDRPSGNARVQVPSDCVNGLSIGASDSPGPRWKRASYSSMGPGRSPGIMKPEILVFGGSPAEPFWVVDSAQPSRTAPTMGTSFATPSGLRMGLGVRTYLGQIITPLAIKALLVHCAEDQGERTEHGWGRIPQNIEDMIHCGDSCARILYQGKLSPAQYLRAQIPLPLEAMQGTITIRATFCYATPIDPQDPGNYTRSGLDVVFRPHSGRRRKGAEHPSGASFFQAHEYQIEQELRRASQKWETILHHSRNIRGSSLQNPVFDIHYNAREGGGKASIPPKIPYALVVSVIAPKTPDLYNKIVRRYVNILRPLQPVITIPIRT